ncbi:MAG: hypothetical protein ACYCX4_02770 [Bacillota bacterium]
MSQVTTMSLISAAGTIICIVLGIVGYSRLAKKDTYDNGSEKGTLQANIEYIKRRTDDVLLEQKDTNKSLNAIAERVTRVEESAKSAHHRIDEIVLEGKR